MNTRTTQSDHIHPRLAALPTRRRTRHGAEQTSLSHNDYTVGWVCALPLELGAAIAMLDEQHKMLPVGPGDNNAYTLGTIDHHNVVLVCLPSYGTAKAATVASHMLRSFPNIQAGLMVGIGGGVPTSGTDVRLGDIVVGNSVVQYDLGKTVRGGKFERIGGSCKSPPDNLKMAVQNLRGRHNLQPSRIPNILSEMLEHHPSTREAYSRPMAVLDRLFEAAYDHVEEPANSNSFPCGRCDASRLVQRPPRPGDHCMIHYGKIASGNQVIKHGKTRECLASELDAVCFEMEAAGLVDANFPCLVVRGISDYADSHKNNRWRGYAAAVAASYAKELLAILPTPMSQNVLSTGFSRPLLQPIVNEEAKLGALLSEGHALIRSDMLRELRATHLALNQSLQIAVHDLSVDKASLSTTGQGHLPDGVSQGWNLDKKTCLKKPEIDPAVSELPLKSPDDIETAQTQLGSAVETLERLGSTIEASTKDMKAVSRSFHHDATRMALKMRRAERLFFRIHRPIQSRIELEQMARFAHLASLTDSSTVASFASSLQKLNCSDQEAEDKRQVSKRPFGLKIEAPVHSRTDSWLELLGLVLMRGLMAGLLAVNSLFFVEEEGHIYYCQHEMVVRSTLRSFPLLKSNFTS